MLVVAHIDIHAAKEAVWKVITDIENSAGIVKGIEKIEIVHRPFRGLVGLRWRETRILFGEPATVEKWITDAAENEYFMTRAEDSGFIFITVNRITEADGVTTLISQHDSQPQTLVARIKSLPMIFFTGVIRKALLQDLNDLKAAAEQR